MFAQKGVELVQELERAKDFLPPFNVNIILSYFMARVVKPRSSLQNRKMVSVRYSKK